MRRFEQLCSSGAIEKEGVLVEVCDNGLQGHMPHPSARASPPFEDGRFRDNNFDGAFIIDADFCVISDSDIFCFGELFRA